MTTYGTFLRTLSGKLDVEQSKRLSDFITSRFYIKNSKVKCPFDDQARDVVLKYSFDPNRWKGENRYLDSIGYGCQRVPGALETQILRFDRDPETGAGHAPDFRWNRNFKKAVKTLKSQLLPYGKLNVVSYSSDSDIEDKIPKKDTHSGFSYILDGKKLKKERLEGSFKAYQLFLEQARRTKSIRMPILAGYRLQVSGAYDESGQRTHKCKHKERLVSMVDVNVILAELQFAKPIQTALGRTQFYGGSKSPDELRDLINRWRDPIKSRWWYSFDYSHYDQSIPAWLIESAFEVLKSMFIRNEWNKSWDWLWNLVVDSFINKSYVMKHGKLFWVKNGVPSGSMFTQIVDTICNLLMVYTYLFSIDKDPSRIFVNSVGDDIVLLLPYSLDVKLVSSYLMHNFGIICHPDKCEYGDLQSSDPHYLSRDWRIRGAYRKPEELFSRLCYPEKRRPYAQHPEMSPELVVYSYILAYPLGMRELIDVDRFLDDCPWVRRKSLKLVGSYLPGYLSYAYNYGLIR